MADREASGQPADGGAADARAGRAEADRGMLRRSLALITVSGCLAMIYSSAVSSPATTDFFRRLGARELEFGLLGGIPLIMIGMQFLGALLTNRLPRRKAAFMALAIASRLVYPVIACVPLFLPEERWGRTLPFLIALLAASGGMAHLMTPIWFSWMGDLIPRRKLSSFWGQRMLWMQVVWIASFLGIWLFTHCADLPITVVFPVLVGAGVTCGILDIMLFIWVREPPNALARNENLVATLAEPFRHADYRTFVLFSCAWSAAVMFGAAFQQIYVLESLGLSVSRTTLIWCMAGTGGVLSAKAWGRLVDRHGGRPVMVLCVSMKSLIVLIFMLITRESATLVLSVAFFFDSMLNAGNAIASNGYMLRLAPRENRSAFIAAITGLAGMCGGVAALLAGVFLKRTAGFAWEGFGRTWNHYQLLFAIGLVLRLSCIGLVRRIRQPKSSRTLAVITAMQAEWPMRMLLFPVGLYRTVTRAARRLDAGPDHP